MTLIRLAARAYRTLQKIIQSSPNARQVRRAQALVWLHENETVQAVATRLRLSRQTIYDIVHRYRMRSHLPVIERIRDLPHPGRPTTQRQRTQQIIQALLTHSPSRFGYRSPIWTVPMLRTQVEKRLQRRISRDTVRRALRPMRYRYKRPRLVLARRSPLWRQAKGG
jgi:transposase